MTSVPDYTTDELAAIAIAGELRDGETIFAGIGTGGRSFTIAVGIPVVAHGFAKGYLGLDVQLQIGPSWDPDVSGATPSVRNSPFCEWPASAQFKAAWGVDEFARGEIDVACVTAAQIDKYGNLNTTLIGDRAKPKVRLVGCVALTEHMACSKRTFVILDHKKRTFVERVDFVSGVGMRRDGDTGRDKYALPGHGPTKVITDMAILGFDPESGRMCVESLHPGVQPEDVIESTGFELLWPECVRYTQIPSKDEIRYIREVVDKTGVWLGVDFH